jgi:hypothetical protein
LAPQQLQFPYRNTLTRLGLQERLGMLRLPRLALLGKKHSALWRSIRSLPVRAQWQGCFHPVGTRRYQLAPLECCLGERKFADASPL